MLERIDKVWNLGNKRLNLHPCYFSKVNNTSSYKIATEKTSRVITTLNRRIKDRAHLKGSDLLNVSWNNAEKSVNPKKIPNHFTSKRQKWTTISVNLFSYKWENLQVWWKVINFLILKCIKWSKVERKMVKASVE